VKSYFSERSQIKVYSEVSDFPQNAEIVISIGGDGTLLQASVFALECDLPVVGLNTGRLGFLSAISIEEIEEALDELVKKEFEIDERVLLELAEPQGLFDGTQLALNEFTLHKKDSSSMITIHAYLGDEFLNSYWADGLIIATPTGSTAYSLSCGGPIIAPGSENFVITPIAPHNLNVRPIVVPDDREIVLHIEGREDLYLASLDSRNVSISDGVKIRLKKAQKKLKLATLPETTYLKTIRKKLSWGLDIRN
jgi:NAD+ kinase